jgi:hypothetical protein
MEVDCDSGEQYNLCIMHVPWLSIPRMQLEIIAVQCLRFVVSLGWIDSPHLNQRLSGRSRLNHLLYVIHPA